MGNLAWFAGRQKGFMQQRHTQFKHYISHPYSFNEHDAFAVIYNLGGKKRNEERTLHD
jgi:hypothetical protein